MLCARRVVLLTSLLLACAGTSPPSTVAAGEGESVDETCEGERLDACVEACFDSTCLDWCAGSSCRVAVGAVHRCMDEVKRGFLEVRPIPRFSLKGPVDRATLEAAIAKMQADSQGWHPAYVAAVDDGWANVCRPRCVELIPSGFCERDVPNYRRWVYAAYAPTTVRRPIPSPPPSEPPPEVSLALVGAQVGEMKSDALSRLIAARAQQLRGVRDCVTEVESVELVFGVELDPNGTPTKVEPVDGEPETGACIAAILERDFTLPSRVVAEFPRVELGVRVSSASR